jgi:hypothetical protein
MELAGGHVFVLDLSSANGTRINRRLIEGLTQLRPGDRLQFGADESVFQLWGPARPPMRRAVPLTCAAMVLAIAVAWAAIGRAVWRAPLAVPTPPTLSKCGVPSSGGLAASEGTVADQGCARLPGKEVGPAVPSTGEIEPLRPDPIERAPSGRAEARAALLADLEQQNGSAELVEVLASYWEGRLTDARAQLKKLAAHAESDDARGRLKAIGEEFSSAERLFKRGEGLLAARAPELAKQPLLKALEHDRRLLEGLGDRYPSFYRRKIQEDMARNCYAKGRQWLERRNQRRACRAWKLGFEFYKGNADLNKAVALCSRRGAEALRKVRTCEQLLEVLDLAVEGDGLAPRVDEMRTALRCRS